MFMVGFFSPLCWEEHDVGVDGCFLLALGAAWVHFCIFVNMLYTLIFLLWTKESTTLMLHLTLLFMVGFIHIRHFFVILQLVLPSS